MFLYTTLWAKNKEKRSKTYNTTTLTPQLMHNFVLHLFKRLTVDACGSNGPLCELNFGRLDVRQSIVIMQLQYSAYRRSSERENVLRKAT